MNLHRNVIIHFAGKVAPAVAQLILLLVGVKMLGTEEFGKYNLVFNTTMIISSLFVGWIQQSLLRFLHPSDANKKTMLTGFFTLTWPSAILASASCLLFSLFYFDLSPAYLLTASVFTGLFSVLLVVLTSSQADSRPVDYALYESLFFGLTVICFLVSVYILNDLRSQIIFNGMVLSLVLVIILAAFRKHISWSRTPESELSAFFKMTFSYGAPITVWLLVSNFYNFFDRYILQHYMGYDAVGVYGSAYDLLFKICGFMALPVILAYHPAISRSWQENNYRNGIKLIKQGVAAMSLTLLVVFALVFTVQEQIFGYLYKGKTEGLSVMFIPIALSAVLWQLAMIIQKPLEFNFRQRVMIIGIVITLVINGLLNWFTIPHFGYTACAFNTLLSTSFYFLFVLFRVRFELRKLPV